MHEMGIALEIIDIVKESIHEKLYDNSIKIINIQIGKLSNVKAENLKFCFKVVSKNTIMNKTKLCIKTIPVVIKCKNCKFEEIINNPFFKCSKCKSPMIKIISGKELDIVSIEIEQKE